MWGMTPSRRALLPVNRARELVSRLILAVLVSLSPSWRWLGGALMPLADAQRGRAGERREGREGRVVAKTLPFLWLQALIHGS